MFMMVFLCRPHITALTSSLGQQQHYAKKAVQRIHDTAGARTKDEENK
ncbi:hypothetical protein AVEN_165783-1, partial [Araneus ventricosus]